jgi:hypothetical protein
MNMAHLPFYSKERGCAFFQDWMVFAPLTHHNNLVLPKAPHGFAVTSFLLVCLGK